MTGVGTGGREGHIASRQEGFINTKMNGVELGEG